MCLSAARWLRTRSLNWSGNEVLETIELELPPTRLDTQAFWMQFSETTIEKLRQRALWAADANDYGEHWAHIRETIIHRDGYRCSLCGVAA